MTDTEVGNSTKDHVPLQSKASYSTCIACFQVGLESAVLTFLGSACASSKVGLSLGFTMPDLALVHMGCTLASLTKGPEPESSEMDATEVDGEA